MTKGNADLTSNSNKENGTLLLSKKNLSSLVKHPNGQKASQVIISYGSMENIRPVSFQSIDEKMISQAENRTNGGFSLSGMDADWWKKILVSSNFSTGNTDIGKAL